MVIERSVHVVQVRQNMLTMGRLRLNWLRDNREKEKPQANLKRQQAATRSIPNNEKSLRKGQRCATLKTWILLRSLKLAKLSYPLRFLSSHSVAASDGPHAKDFYDHLETACSLLFLSFRVDTIWHSLNNWSFTLFASPESQILAHVLSFSQTDTTFSKWNFDTDLFFYFLSLLLLMLQSDSWKFFRILLESSKTFWHSSLFLSQEYLSSWIHLKM